MTKILIYIISLVSLMILIGCEVGDPSEEPAEVVIKGEKVFIRDKTGKEWDVTHAVRNYGFQADKFQFGLGPFAITPINNPKMLNPGDPGYPSDEADFLVIGTRINSDERAYPLSVLSRHENANEQFGDTHVAVAY